MKEKEIIGVIESKNLDKDHSILVTPVYYDGENYYLKYMSKDFGELLKLLVTLQDVEQDEEIDAYINRENSLYKEHFFRYHCESNFYYKRYDEKILDNLDFYPISEFTQVKQQDLVENYQDYTYGIIEERNKLIVGDFNFVEENLQNKTSRQLLNLKKIDELIHKINRQATELKESLA